MPIEHFAPKNKQTTRQTKKQSTLQTKKQKREQNPALVIAHLGPREHQYSQRSILQYSQKQHYTKLFQRTKPFCLFKFGFNILAIFSDFKSIFVEQMLE